MKQSFWLLVLLFSSFRLFASVGIFPCENMASLAERQLCERVKHDLGGQIDIEYFSENSNQTMQTDLSGGPKLLIRKGTENKTNFITLSDIQAGRVAIELEETKRKLRTNRLIRKSGKEETKVSIQKRKITDNTLMLLLLPRQNEGSGDFSELPVNNTSDTDSEGVPDYLIIPLATGFVIYLGGWAATAIDIWESHFHGTTESRRHARQIHPGWSLAAIAGAVLTFGGGALVKIAVGHCYRE